MIIECKGIRTPQYYLPPFEINTGELVVIYLGNGAYVQDLRKELSDIFRGKVKHEQVTITEPVAYAEHDMIVPAHKVFFLPQTVGSYITRRAGNNIEIAETIYDRAFLKKSTRLANLRSRARRLLSIYCAFSRSRNVVFDLKGLALEPAKEVFEVVKQLTRKGCAILLDNYDDMKNDCSKFITVELNENIVQEDPKRNLR